MSMRKGARLLAHANKIMASSQRAEAKVREGSQHMQKAEKCLKTSWLKWKADYDGAAQAYTNAANCFRNGKAYNLAKEAFLKASDAQFQCNAVFHSAKALELAGQMAKEMKQIQEAADLMGRAAHRFRENGTVDTASQVFEKTARLLENVNNKKAIEYYMTGVDLLETEDKNRQAVEMVGKAVKLMVRERRFEASIAAIKKQIEMYSVIGNTGQICRATVGLVVIHLAREDTVEAGKVFSDAISMPGFGDSDEATAIEELLDAYDSSDLEEMQKITARAIFTYMDNELAKLARSLRPAGEMKPRALPKEVALPKEGALPTELPSTLAARDELFSGGTKDEVSSATNEEEKGQKDEAGMEGVEDAHEGSVEEGGEPDVENEDDDEDEFGLR
eukprot:m.309258 g.309258  ORF g.309258 m.309258 type:complete len:390 (+) comp45907_c0_seq1:149-1318(+)